MKRTILSVIFTIWVLSVFSQTESKPFKAYLVNDDYEVYLRINFYDKNLIDEFWAIINIENKTYSLGSHRHVLCGGSGHGSIGRITPEKVNSWKPKEGEDEIKAILMVAQATIDELRVIEGIEVITALDFGLLDIIPSPDEVRFIFNRYRILTL